MQIITLTLSPAFDVHAGCECFAAGKENLIRVIKKDAGGKGVNVSRALASFGVKSIPFILLGEENGTEYIKKLTEEGLSPIALTVPGKIRENLTIHEPDGRETRISYEGFEANPTVINRIKEKLPPLSPGDVLTLTGSLPRGITPKDMLPFLTHYKTLGVKIVIDSKSYRIEDLLSVKPYLIKPNEEELAALIGKTTCGMKESEVSAKDLVLRGIENVLITLGERGAILANRDGIYHCAAPKMTPKSTIGAGDSAIAGYLVGALQNPEEPKILKMAVAFGSAACLTEGTDPPECENILKFFSEIKIDTIL